MVLTVIAASNSAGSSVLDRLTDAPAQDEAPADAGLTAPLAPAAGDDAPVLPTAD
jgi:preprotein translocase subunit SecG